METRRPDPLGVGAELPFAGTYHPIGFRLDLETNSREVLAAAEEAWHDAVSEFRSVPLTLRVVVSPDGKLAPPAKHYRQGHLHSIVSDSDNFAHIDLRSRFAFVQVSRATASDHSWFRWFYLEAIAYTMLCHRDLTMFHAGCVERDGRGLLLCGPTTAGKSTLSYACARAGWAWLADDCTCVLPGSEGRVAIARSPVARFRPDAPGLFPELERYAVRARPTGKLGIEVPMGEVPGIRVARRAPIRAIAFLDRRGGAASCARVEYDEAVESLLADMPLYGPDVDPFHEEVVRAVAQAPAFRVRYESVTDALRLLADV